MPWEKELAIAEAAAREAGVRLREIRLATLDVLSEIGRDIKLQADRDAEAIILGALQSGTPHPVLAEESGEHGAPADGVFWVVDPLDGTMNYARGWDLCAVSIGLVEAGEPVAGVVYDFNRDEMFVGAAGAGATMNGAPMRVTEARELYKAVLYTGFPILTDFSDPALGPWLEVVKRVKKVRMLGTSTLGTTWLACGRLDVYAENDVMLWDVAAGVALIRAAGGVAELQLSPRAKWARRLLAAATPELLEGLKRAGEGITA